MFVRKYKLEEEKIKIACIGRRLLSEPLCSQPLSDIEGDEDVSAHKKRKLSKGDIIQLIEKMDDAADKAQLLEEILM